MYTAKMIKAGQEFKDDHSPKTYIAKSRHYATVNHLGQVVSTVSDYDNGIQLNLFGRKYIAQEMADYLNRDPMRAAAMHTKAVARFKEIVDALKAKRG